MMTRMVALLLVVVAVSGCGPRTIPVASPADVDQANREIRDRRVTMSLVDGTRIPCERAVVGLDTCVCVDSRVGAAVRRLPASSVESIKIGRPGRGALWGLLIGGGLGGLLGGINYWSDPGDWGAALEAAVLPVVFGAIGLVVAPFATYDLYEIVTDADQPASNESSDGGTGDLNGELAVSATATPPN